MDTRAAELARALGDADSEATALFNVADTAHAAGDIETADVNYRRALAHDGFAFDFKCLLGLAFLHGQRGEVDQARALFERCIDRCRERMSAGASSYLAFTLALALLGRGEVEQALQAFSAALQIDHSPGAIQAALMDIEVLQRSRSPVAGVDAAVALLRRALPAGST